MNRLKWTIVPFTALIFFGGVARAEDAKPIATLQELMTEHADTFEITVLSHYSDDDFGFHVQTAVLPRGGFFFSRFRIGADQATQIVRELAATDFAKNSMQGERNQDFRPAKPMKEERVYSIVVRCGDSSFFEDVRSKADMKNRAEAVAAAFSRSKIGSSFRSAFLSKLGD